MTLGCSEMGHYLEILYHICVKHLETPFYICMYACTCVSVCVGYACVFEFLCFAAKRNKIWSAKSKKLISKK